MTPLNDSARVKRLVILASGSGSNALALLDATRVGAVAAEVVAIVSDRPHAGALQRAADAGIAAVAVPPRCRSTSDERAAYDRQLAEVVAGFSPDLVVLAGWMLILGPAFLERFPGRIINVHPALLPGDGGAEVMTSRGVLPALRGAHAVREAVRLCLPLTGATVHFVTPRVDAGPVILQEEVPIRPDDDEQRLHERIKVVEHRLLPRAVALALAALDSVESEDEEE